MAGTRGTTKLRDLLGSRRSCCRQGAETASDEPVKGTEQRARKETHVNTANGAFNEGTKTV